MWRTMNVFTSRTTVCLSRTNESHGVVARSYVEANNIEMWINSG